MSTETIRVIIPIFTFILGCAFTFFARRAHDKGQILQTSIREVHRLTTAWYNQIHTLPIRDIKSKENTESSEHHDSYIYEYIYNRIILPDLLLHLKVINSSKKCIKLSNYIEMFLDKVTEKRLLKSENQLDDKIERVANARSFSKNEHVFDRNCPYREIVNKDKRIHLLKELDSILQTVSRECGSILN